MYSKDFCYYLLFYELNDDVILSYDKFDQCDERIEKKRETNKIQNNNINSKKIVTRVRSQMKPNPFIITFWFPNVKTFLCLPNDSKLESWMLNNNIKYSFFDCQILNFEQTTTAVDWHHLFDFPFAHILWYSLSDNTFE